MPKLLAQYLSGDCQLVRDQLRKRIDAESPSAAIAEAVAVADEFVERSIRNLSRLHAALVTIGYEFEHPEETFVLRDSSDEGEVARFEEEMGGRMSILAARWYRRVKSLDFTQTYQQLSDRESPLAGLGWNTPLILQSLEKAQGQWQQQLQESKEEAEHWKKEGLSFSDLTDETPELLTGGCASNNECMGLALGSTRFDDVLYNDGFGDQYLGDEIAEAFHARGFRIFTADPEARNTISTLYGEPDMDFVAPHLPAEFLEV